MAPVTVLAASTDRQALIPMAAGYLILMSALALGLYRLYRPKATRAEDGQSPGGSSPGPSPADRSSPGPSPADPSPAGSRQRSGWAALARRVMGTVVGGYLLLQAVVVAYYYAVARVGPGFLESAVTGTALLLGLALPVFAAASWLAERRRRRGRSASPRPHRPSRSAGQLPGLPGRALRWPDQRRYPGAVRHQQWLRALRNTA
jgi:hypothetical protein